jgi:hypothetical protein
MKLLSNSARAGVSLFVFLIATTAASSASAPTIGNDGYLTITAGKVDLKGYIAAAVGGTGTTTTLTHSSNEFCASGTIAANPSYKSWAAAGFNVNQAQSTAGSPANPLQLSGSSITVNYQNKGTSGLHLQLLDNSFNFWCYDLKAVTGPVTIPLDKFNTKCWDNTGSAFQSGTSIQAIQLVASGSNSVSVAYNFCFEGLSVN